MVRYYGATNRVFFIKQATGRKIGRIRTIKNCLGELTIADKQGEKLADKKSPRLSPLFEKCCLRLTGNLSYQKASQEIEVKTGVKLGYTCLHTLVEKQEWSEPTEVSYVGVSML